jgi:hypothetical protein
VDTTTATKELTENRDVAPLLEADVPPVLADSEMSVGVAPFVKALPHVEDRSLETDDGIKPGKSVCTMLSPCLTQLEQVTFCGRLELPETKSETIRMMVVRLMVPAEAWMSVRSSGIQSWLAELSFKQATCLTAG